MASLYIAVFVLLVVIQFPSAGPVTALAGGVSFRGLPGADGKGIRSAELGADGLRLVFSERYPLTLRNAAGKERTAVPVAYESRDDGFLVRFDDGTTMSVSGDDDGRASWRLAPKAAAAAATMRYELAYGAALIAPADDGSLRLSLGGSTYRISGVSSSGETRTLTLSAAKGVLRPFVAAREAEGKTTAPAQFIAQAPMEGAAWAKEISDWREKAWAAFSGPSFDAAAGTWATAAGAPGSFDEATFVAYMAFKALTKVGARTPVKVFITVFIAGMVTYITAAVQLALAYGEFMTSLVSFLAVFAITQIPLGIVEGILFVIFVDYLERARPDLTEKILPRRVKDEA